MSRAISKPSVSSSRISMRGWRPCVERRHSQHTHHRPPPEASEGDQYWGHTGAGDHHPPHTAQPWQTPRTSSRPTPRRRGRRRTRRQSSTSPWSPRRGMAGRRSVISSGTQTPSSSWAELGWVGVSATIWNWQQDITWQLVIYSEDHSILHHLLLLPHRVLHVDAAGFLRHSVRWQANMGGWQQGNHRH